MKNKYVIGAYRLVIIIFCLYGILSHVITNGNELNWKVFWFYTILSNLFVLVYFIIAEIALIKDMKEKRTREITVAPNVKGAVVIVILTTFLIYNFILAPTAFQMGGDFSYFNLSNLAVHVFVPLLVLFDWLLFDQKGCFKPFSPLLWFIPLVIYFIAVVMRAMISGQALVPSGSKYPYFFIDIDQLGIVKVVINVSIIAVGYIIMGYIFYFIDKKMAK